MTAVPVHIDCIPACLGCGMGVDPERYRKRPYCIDPDCIRELEQPLVIRQIGVHKAIPQFVLADDTRSRELVAAGRRRS